MRLDGMVHGALVLAEHARADIISIDTSEAEGVPGVVRVFTAADVPGALKTGLIHKDWPLMIPVGGRTSFLGDVLAVVVAEDREVARRAAKAVRVDYFPNISIGDAPIVQTTAAAPAGPVALATPRKP